MIDTHCHIDDPQYAEGLDAFLAEQRKDGVQAILVPGVDSTSVKDVLEVCDRYPEYLFPALGLHPENVKEDWEEQLRVLKEAVDQRMSSSNPLIAIGEIGLDANVDNLDYQGYILDQQLELAKKLQRPVALHSVGAVGELYEHLKPYAGCVPEMLIHSPSMSYEMAEKFLKLGAVFSFNIFVLNEDYVRMRELAARLPPEAIRFETDSPRRIFSGYGVGELNGLIGPELLPEVHKEVLAIRRRYAARGVLS